MLDNGRNNQTIGVWAARQRSQSVGQLIGGPLIEPFIGIQKDEPSSANRLDGEISCGGEGTWPWQLKQLNSMLLVPADDVHGSVDRSGINDQDVVETALYHAVEASSDAAIFVSGEYDDTNRPLLAVHRENHPRELEPGCLPRESKVSTQEST